MAANDDDWVPPSEAEMKILAAKRDRSNKISSLMGRYMLKGHKMLATTCPIPECQTIEMQDKTGRVYCIACTEVDAVENAKDDPVMASRRAPPPPAVNEPPVRLATVSRAMAIPTPEVSSNNTPPSFVSRNVPILAEAHAQQAARAESTMGWAVSTDTPDTSLQPQPSSSNRLRHRVLPNTVDTITTKIELLNEALKNSSEPAKISEILTVIRECYDTIKHLEVL